MFLPYVSRKVGKPPSDLCVEDLTVDFTLSFLDNLEEGRSNCIRTRKSRLAAIKSFFRYVEFQVPSCLDLARQIHAIPFKLYTRPTLAYLDRDEIEALLAAPGREKRNDIRDRAMLWLLYSCGLRISELVNLSLDSFGHNFETVLVHGKGRRERVLPLWKQVQSALRAWPEVRPGEPTGPLFLNERGDVITRHGFASRLRVHVRVAGRKAPSLQGQISLAGS